MLCHYESIFLYLPVSVPHHVPCYPIFSSTNLTHHSAPSPHPPISAMAMYSQHLKCVIRKDDIKALLHAVCIVSLPSTDLRFYQVLAITSARVCGLWSSRSPDNLLITDWISAEMPHGFSDIKLTACRISVARRSGA